MHLQLIVPGLLWPEAHAAGAMPPAGTLELLFARGRRSRRDAASPDDWLADAAGISAQQDRPFAPHALRADGGTPDDAYWLRADPVHLRLQRDALLLADARMFALSREEADALVASLNAHFGSHGLALEAPHPTRWYARLAAAPSLTTTPLSKAAGQSVDPNLPRGADAAAWHARINEVQMLLHAHPVNEAREARGEMPVNSLWFWGGGTLVPRDEDAPRAFSHLWAADALPRGLGIAAGASVAELPQSASALLAAAPAEGVGMVLLDALATPASYGDLAAWSRGVAALEAGWIAPLAAALREQRIGMLTVHAFGGGSGPQQHVSAEATRHDLRRFWRRAKALAHYVEAGTA